MGWAKITNKSPPNSSFLAILSLYSKKAETRPEKVRPLMINNRGKCWKDIFKQQKRRSESASLKKSVTPTFPFARHTRRSVLKRNVRLDSPWAEEQSPFSRLGSSGTTLRAPFLPSSSVLSSCSVPKTTVFLFPCQNRRCYSRQKGNGREQEREVPI